MNMPRTILLAGISLSICVSATNAVLITEKKEVKKTTETGEIHGARNIEIDTGAATYLLRYSYQFDKAGKKIFDKYEGPFSGLGLGPNSANWRLEGQGFFSAVVDGTQILCSELAEIKIMGQGRKGLVSISWKHEKADVTLNIIALDKDDKLMFEVSLNPKGTIKSFELRFKCFPYYYFDVKDPEKKARDRWIATAKRKVQHKADVELSPEEDWVYYYDTVIKTGGPAALMIRQGESAKIKLEVQDYCINTSISYPPEAQHVHFALWDFGQGISWEEGLERMNGLAEKAREDLRKESFRQPQKIEIRE